MLKDFVYEDYLDLALIAVINLGENGDGQATAKVSNNMLTQWNVDAETVLADAKANTLSEKPVFATMFDMLMGLLENSDREIADILTEDTPIPMYVLTNKAKVFGAVHLLNTEVLQEISKAANATKVYIIPSSVHELIVLPVNDDTDTETLTGMIRSVNAEHVAPEEVLSDHPYIFDSVTETVTIA